MNQNSSIQIFDTALKQQSDYWLKKLEGRVVGSNIKLDYERPANYEAELDALRIELPAEAYARLRRLTNDSALLLYTTLLAVLEVCLYRHTGNERVVVGSPVKRKEDGSAPASGAVVIVEEIDGEASFRDLLLKVRQNLVEAYANQDYPFERVLRDLGVEDSENRCPLFNIVLALQNFHGELPPLKHDITISFLSTTDSLRATVTYNRRLFRRDSVERFVGHYLNVLQVAVGQTGITIRELELMDASERRQVLVEWNRTQQGSWPHPNIHQVIEAQAAITPHAQAVVGEQGHLTYGELNARANQLAHYLRRLGVCAETRVGLCVERSTQTLVGILGILKAGAAYVPLDASYPSARLALILEDAGALVLLTQKRLVERFPQGSSRVVCLDADWEAIGRESAANPETVARADNLAYIIYTSGTTGQPKGVMITHRNVIHLTCARFAYHSEPVTAFMLVSPVTFDASVAGIFWTLCQGGTLVLPHENLQQHIPQVVAAMSRQRVSHIICTPSLYQTLLELGGEEKLASLRVVVVAGESCPQKLVTRHYEMLPHAALFNEYGPTENTVWSTVYECASDTPPVLTPIGRPIANTQAYILDEELKPVPVGVAGELYVGGAGLARGYLNLSAHTAERFIPHPYAEGEGARLYRTGDLARFLHDGNIEFLGRADNQVKVRGFRVEAEEIEAALLEHPFVREAAVVARDDGAGSVSLAAYVVPVAQQPLKQSELYSFLGEKLPPFMLPAAFVFMDELPRSAHGKVVRQALPAPEQAKQSAKELTGAAATRTPVEEIVAGIFGELLQVEVASADDDFFKLGGHSLLATQLASRLREAFGIEIPLGTVFESPSLSGIAATVETTMLEARGLEAPPLEAAPRVGRLPLSFAQQRLWLLDQLEPGNPFYNVPAALRLKGELDLAALEHSLNAVLRRHEALRTFFTATDGTPEQCVHPAWHYRVPLIDLQDIPRTRQEIEVARLVAEEAYSPFDLSQAPLLRVTLLRLSGQEHILLLTMHHIVSDGWSMGVLIRELTTLYEAYCQGRPAPLKELPLQYADYTLWQRRWLQGEVLEKQLSYWRHQLSGAPPVLELPLARPRPAVQSFRGAKRAMTLPAELSGQLKALSREEGATLFMTLLAAFQIMLSRTTGHEDIVIGTDVANRTRIEIEPLIGFFVNTLALRTRLAGNPRFREVLRQVRDVALGAYMHQDVPFEMIVNELQPERSLSYNPVIQALLVVQNAPAAALELPGLGLSLIETSNETSKFDVALFLTETKQGISGSWVYNTDLLDAAAVAKISGYYETLLGSIVAQPDARISALEILTEAERKQRDAAQKERQSSKLRRFKKIVPQAVNLSEVSSIKIGQLQNGGTLPLLVEPDFEDADLVDWAGANRPFIESQLLKHGAILFRGFDVRSVVAFEQAAQVMSSRLFGEYGDLPRESLSRNIYGSTPYPADQPILFHNESSHLHRWPMKIWFYCVRVAEEGGETPVVDCRRVYSSLDPALRDRFERKKLMYVRNYTGELDVSWQDFFRVSDRAAVEEYCRQAGVQCEWKNGSQLRTRQVGPAIVSHPQTGERVFFNQLQLHHVSCLDPLTRRSLLAMLREEDLPRNVYYGDGTPIEESVVEEVVATYRQLAVSFRWQRGDILLLNNMLVAHGRNPFKGERKIVVAMGEMVNQEEVMRARAGGRE